MKIRKIDGVAITRSGDHPNYDATAQVLNSSYSASDAFEMATVFDVVTVTCFVGLVIAFFQFTDRETRTLVHFILAGIVFAVANQIGNNGSMILAIILILAGTAYAVIATRK